MAIQKVPLYIKYSNEVQSPIDLAVLGESLIGFQKVIKDLIQIANIDSEYSISVERITEGSIDVSTLINFASNLPFRNLADFYNFIQFIGDEVPKDLINAISIIDQSKDSIESYFAKNPVQLLVLWELIRYLVPKLIALTPRQKGFVKLDKDLPVSYAMGLNRLINKGSYKRAIQPIIENDIAEISISADEDYKKNTIINEKNFSDYLGENEEILPELSNGARVNLTGEILAISSTKGESLRFKAIDLDKKNNLLTAYPADGKKTDDFMQFYKKRVVIQCEVVRKTMFRRPELVINDINLFQQNLPLFDQVVI